MQITVLGSGTSTGVPIIGKTGGANISDDPKDTRLRSSILVEDDVAIIVDTGPDFRAQMLRNGTTHLDAVLYTHYHYDHIGGLDDLRPLSFRHENGMDIYCDEPTYEYIHHRYDYIKKQSSYANKPRLRFHIHSNNSEGMLNPLHIGSFYIQPVLALHVEESQLHSVGYIFNRKFVYLTDFKKVLPEYENLIKECQIAILGTPLPTPHPNHISNEEAFELIRRWGIPQGYITHLADKKTHRELTEEFPENIFPAYDGLTIKID